MILKKLEQIGNERGVSVRSLREEANAGRLKVYRVRPGRNAPMLTTDSDFDAWLQNHAAKRAGAEKPVQRSFLSLPKLSPAK